MPWKLDFASSFLKPLKCLRLEVDVIGSLANLLSNPPLQDFLKISKISISNFCFESLILLDFFYILHIFLDFLWLGCLQDLLKLFHLMKVLQ